MFFESAKRSGGGKIEKLERLEPDVAHITFATAEGVNIICNEFSHNFKTFSYVYPFVVLRVYDLTIRVKDKLLMRIKARFTLRKF